MKRRSLNDPLRKIERAHEHLEVLEQEIREFLESKPYRATREENAQVPDYILYAFRLEKPAPRRLGLIVGDVVHNLRSALDQLAWQLARCTTETPFHRTAFPIFKERTAATRKLFHQMLRDVPPKAREIIEEMQPYHRGDTAEIDPLWILDKLWNIDKHRVILPLPFRMTLPPVEGSGYVHQDVKDDGTILVGIPKSFEPEKNFEPQISFDVAFQMGGPAGGASVENLVHIHDTIRDEIFPRFDEFVAESSQHVERRIHRPSKGGDFPPTILHR